MSKPLSHPLVSVVIPTYNRGHVIRRAIDSVINQTYKNLEIIVVDDVSTDNTRDILEKITDKRVKCFTRFENGGCAAARNTGIKKSNGRFIALLDSDDEYLPRKIEESLKVFNNSSFKVGIVASSYYHVDKREVSPLPDENINMKRFLPLCSTWVLRRGVFEKIGLFNEGVIITQDAEFFWRFRKKFSVCFIREPLVAKYSLSDRSHASKKKIIRSRKKTILNLRRQGHIKLTARFLNILGKDYRGFGDMNQAKKYFLKAFKVYPINFGYFINFLKSYKIKVY